jgi:hypothetical protein
MGAVVERLKFLPHGLVLQLQRLLVDSRVDAWERSHFLDALEREKDLTKFQKQDVKRLIDSWFTRDAATLPPPTP